MARLARHHDDLTAVVSLVRDEVSEHVADVEREISPHVALGRRDAPLGRDAKLEQGLDPGATPLQRGDELPWRGPTMIDASGDCNAVLAAERLDPHTPDVVQVGRDRPNRAPWHP